MEFLETLELICMPKYSLLATAFIVGLRSIRTQNKNVLLIFIRSIKNNIFTSKSNNLLLLKHRQICQHDAIHCTE